MFYETGFRIIKTLYSLDYCVEPEKYPPHLFPLEIDFKGIKIMVKNHEHFLSLNSRQILFTLQAAKTSELTTKEKEFRLSPHPKTYTF